MELHLAELQGFGAPVRPIPIGNRLRDSDATEIRRALELAPLWRNPTICGVLDAEPVCRQNARGVQARILGD